MTKSQSLCTIPYSICGLMQRASVAPYPTTQRGVLIPQLADTCPACLSPTHMIILVKKKIPPNREYIYSISNMYLHIYRLISAYIFIIVRPSMKSVYNFPIYTIMTKPPVFLIEGIHVSDGTLSRPIHTATQIPPCFRMTPLCRMLLIIVGTLTAASGLGVT